jgi:hypothetical protein
LTVFPKIVGHPEVFGCRHAAVLCRNLCVFVRPACASRASRAFKNRQLICLQWSLESCPDTKAKNSSLANLRDSSREGSGAAPVGRPFPFAPVC